MPENLSLCGPCGSEGEGRQTLCGDARAGCPAHLSAIQMQRDRKERRLICRNIKGVAPGFREGDPVKIQDVRDLHPLFTGVAACREIHPAVQSEDLLSLRASEANLDLMAPHILCTCGEAQNKADPCVPGRKLIGLNPIEDPQNAEFSGAVDSCSIGEKSKIYFHDNSFTLQLTYSAENP